MPQLSSPTVSFIVPVRNDAERLKRCLCSIQANAVSGTHVEIIVIDNASTDRSPEVGRQAGALVLTRADGRVSELRNVAAEHASGDVLAFVDADHEIVPTWVAETRATLESPDVAAAGSLCHAPVDGTWVQRAYGALRGLPQGRHDVEWLGSGNMAVRRDVFKAVGGFDTSLTTCEDVDLCNRIRAAGHRIVSNAAMKNVHYGDPASLRELFKGEQWRGRDNLRVSLRTGLTWRGLPSILIPIVDACLLALMVIALMVALLTESWPGVFVASACATVIASLAALRVVRIIVREHETNPLMLLRAWIVAGVYDLARACALVTRAPHRQATPQTVTAQ